MEPCGCLQHLVDGFTSATITIESTTSAGATYETVINYSNKLTSAPPAAAAPQAAAKPVK